MDNKKTGLIIIAVAIVLIIGLFFASGAISGVYDKLITKNIEVKGDCFTEDAVCLHEEKTKAQIPILILSIILITLFVFGVYLTLKKEHKKKDLKETIAKLQGDEKKIIEKIIEHEGSIYQSDLVDHMQFGKVKTTRILDKLEGKGLIERKRRGMTNIVILKN